MSDTYTATGRRKTAVARVWLTEGTGEITINEEPFEEVLTTLTLQGQLLEPLQALKDLCGDTLGAIVDRQRRRFAASVMRKRL